MKDLQSVLKLLVVALVAAVVLAAVLTGRTAVREYYAYQTFVAPRTLHQMTIEMETAGRPERGHTLFWGAALGLAAVAIFGGMIFAMQGGTGFLRELRLGRRGKKRKPSREPAGEYAAPRIASPAPRAPYLLPEPEPEETYYLPEEHQNYANDTRP